MDIIRDRLHMDKPVILRSDLRRDNLILLKKDVTCQKKLLEERLEFRIKKLCKLIDKYHKDGLVLIFAQTTTYVDALYNILEEISPAMLHAITPESSRNVTRKSCCSTSCMVKEKL